MRLIFADTFFFLALLNPADRAHEEATELLRLIHGDILTTGWVLTEVADALAAPMMRRSVCQFIEDIESDSRARIIHATKAQFSAGMDLYRRRADKAWSLTDCISFVTMTELGITDALTTDRHFAQAGFNLLFKAR